jgi:hypothetical protein
MVIKNKNYDQCIVAIRELALDLGPVQSFAVRKAAPGFIFSKDASELVMGTDTYTLPSAEMWKVYHVITSLVMRNALIDVYADHVPVELVTGLKDFSYTADDLEEEGGQVVWRNNYFTTEVIAGVIEDFFNKYVPYDGIERSVSEIVNTLDYLDTRKMCYWVAYYLIDKRRANTAAAEQLQKNNTFLNITTSNTGNLTTTERTVTMRIGESFAVTEAPSKDDTEVTGFKSFWGDKYDFLTKMQLYLRDRYERLFNDFSLRDNVAVSTSVTLEKNWNPSAYFDTHDLSNFTRDLIQ